MNRAYDETYDALLALAARLDAQRRMPDGSVDAHATAAMHAARFAASILRPRVPEAAPLPFAHSTERLLELTRVWREAALEDGEFAPTTPVLTLIEGEKGRT
ncbi:MULTISPECIES: hypothetical protein [unclassified Streptomyces]|uniref:hypothetical protein n=1 Tax=unclassified Streptomyces TaxID=2593676 RepID=UPI002366C1D3|nr:MULTISPECIES: hypothetical protein [unclassified Streptomyces]MDF3141071.1 hypothetical protein [Streptomyces sp. T21Q-yed]WDF45056.1 hypothetical protein PBV52_51060 [Streptomyces sp. T12]